MHESLVSHWDPHWDHTGTTLGPYVDPIWDHVVDVFVGQLSVPPVVAQTVGRLCGSTVCATIGGTDSCVTKTSSTQTVENLCGQSV